MASNRGGVACWVGGVRCLSRKPPSRITWRRSGSQVVSCQLSRAAWALSPPNSLRYQSIKQPLLSNPFPLKEQWEDSHTVCVLIQPGDSSRLHSLLHLSLSRPLAPGDLFFPLTTVDGRREDDISVETLKTHGAGVSRTESGCFRSLFESEGCPAPYMYGSSFYCFHCPSTHLQPGDVCRPGLLYAQDVTPTEESPLPPASLCARLSTAERGCGEGGGEDEQKLLVMYERLRVELPSFFMTKHDYSMYSNDVDFIFNGLINVRTRGRVLYHLILSSWRLLCLCYYAEARLDVLKLTKHVEDGTIKARWRIKGLPFHSALLRFSCKDKSHLYRSYDAFSTFHLGADGLIRCHTVEKVMPAQPPLLPRVTSLLGGALVALGVQEHRPALNLLPLLLSALRHNRK